MEPRSSKYRFGKMYKPIFHWFQKCSKLQKIVIITIAVLLVTASGASAWYYSRLTDMKQMFPVVFEPNPVNNNEPSIDVTAAFENSKLNVVFLGFDKDESRLDRYEVFRPDAIMVAAIDLETGKVDIVSIPRDSLVTMYNSKGIKDKINGAYEYGWKYGGATEDSEKHNLGLKYMLETVSMALKGIRIHYYVTIDMDGVEEAVNILGGIWYDVPELTMHNSGRIIAEPGYQRLTGKKFVDYLRSRQFASGDIQRIQNQQSILISAFDQFKQADTLLAAPNIILSLRSHIETNLSLEQIGALAYFGNKNVELDFISTHVLEGSSAIGRLDESWTKSYWYLLLDQQRRVDLIERIWGIAFPPDPADVLFPPLNDEIIDPSYNPSHPSDYPIRDPGSIIPGEGTVDNGN